MAEEGHIIKPDEPYRALFKELAKATPACALCHLGPEMDSIIKCLMTEDNVTQLSSVMKALVDHHHHPWPLPPHLRPPLEEVLRVAKAPFQQVAEEEDIMEPNAGDVDDAVFPFLPILRARGVYEADIRRKKIRSCKKISPRHFALIPGIFTVLCKHGVCTSSIRSGSIIRSSRSGTTSSTSSSGNRSSSRSSRSGTTSTNHHSNYAQFHDYDIYPCQQINITSGPRLSASAGDFLWAATND
ncbi:uncharacterized protein LOC121720256 [Alosa sapidissima]|uniref:uncharacterized protein LOC121720256 n=1 Tax=Alosa sapidissima TaxID=34773 RepID=UPI001C0851A3|nr:uncharacterized protein LOC121720256 [Alosa sapidissima]